MQTDETRDRQAALERLMAQYGTALLRMESEKTEELHDGDKITLHIAPEDVMPMTE